MKKLLEKAKLLLAKFFGNLDRFLARYAAPAVEYANQIRNFVENPFVQLIVDFTPTPIDNMVLSAVRNYADRVILKMDLVKECAKLETKEERLKCFVNALKNFSQPVREALYLKFASMYAKEISGIATVRDSAFDTAVQTHYFSTKLKAA